MPVRFRASFVGSFLSYSTLGLVAVATITACSDDIDTSTDTNTETETDTDTDSETDTESEPDPDPTCGDGTVDDGEECDDGDNESGDGCSAACSTEEPDPEPVCGDGTVDDGEECDDNNTIDDDGCSASCLIEPEPEPFCGDGTLDPDESCDDGNLADNDACPSTCEPAACGDGFTQEGIETCDDGGFDPADGCGPNCSVEGLPYFEDFDDGAHDLTLTTSSATVLWHITDTFAASAPNSLNFADPATNNYADDSQVSGTADTTYFLVPAGGATVSFNLRKDTEEEVDYDLFFGRVLDAADVVVAEHRVDATFSTFEVVSFSIPASAAGTYVRVRLAFDSIDELYNDTTGVFVDDLLVDVGACGDGATNAGEDCDDGNQIDDDGCSNSCTLVCASGTGASAAVLDAGSGHCYAMFGTPGSFTAAQTSCEGIGGDLVSISSAAENALVLGLYPGTDTLLIGATDAAAEGIFAWTNGDAFTYANWGSNEPNNSGGNEHCVEMLSDGVWNDLTCDLAKPYVCEVP